GIVARRRAADVGSARPHTLARICPRGRYVTASRRAFDDQQNFPIYLALELAMTTKTLEICDPTGAARARIALQRGFNCYSFEVRSGGGPVALLWSDPAFIEGTGRPSRTGIPVLFPFAGRLRGTKYRYEGQEYSLNVGDDFGNAIHGFVLN